MFNKNIKIETERLVMRPFTIDDINCIYSIMKDKEMYIYTPDEPWKSVESAEEFIKMVLWLYDLDNNTFRHFFAITEKQSGEIVGMCGIGGVEYDRTENEVFYHIGKNYWNQGYASEASIAMLEYAFMNLELSKIIGIVHPDNIASIKVLEKIGLKRHGTINGLSEEFNSFNGEYLYLLLKEEYFENKV